MNHFYMEGSDFLLIEYCLLYQNLYKDNVDILCFRND